MSYKDAWNEKYCELSLEMYDKEYWEIGDTQRAELDKAINTWQADYVANLIDEAKDRAKYEGIA